MAELKSGSVQFTTTANAVPVAVGVPVTTVMDRGIEWTGGIAGLFVRQKLELGELLTGLEGKNKYNIVQIPIGSMPNEKPTSVLMAPYREQANDHALLKAREQSECFERICCPLFRGFKMDFTDAANTNFFTIERPFKCDPCYGPPLCMTKSQELSIKDKNGSLVAKAEETTGCCKACCTRSFSLTGPDGNEYYTMEASECGTATGGNNCCAPTCFSEGYEIVLKEHGHVKNGDSSFFVWPGCNCGGMTDLSNMMIKFPDDATPEKRVAIVAGMMLIEYAVQEFKRQQNKDNGGGSGGAPPKNNEMKR